MSDKNEENIEPLFDEKSRNTIIKDILEKQDIHQKICGHLDKTVKRDKPLKDLIVCVAFSTYTNNPLNLFLAGPSSIGKTHNATEALKYFPEEDQFILGGLSPTAIVHDLGVFDEKKKAHVVNLEDKILVFLESPSNETFMKLRPILSHDKEQINYKFTDKSSKGSLKTKTVIIHGWPAIICCTSQVSYIEDLVTRGFTVTPEMSSEKYKEVIKLKAKTQAFPIEIQRDNELTEIEEAIRILKQTLKERQLRAVLPYAKQLADVFPHSLARDMRDFSRFTQLIEMYSLFSMFRRNILLLTDSQGIETELIIATQEDFDKAKNLGNKIFETTRAGLPKNVLDFFKQVLLPAAEPIGKTCYSELLDKQKEVYGKSIGRSTLKTSYIDLLEQVGYVDVLESTIDRRTKEIVVKETADSSELFQTDFSNFFGENDLENWFNYTKNNFDCFEVKLITSLTENKSLPFEVFCKEYFCQNNSNPEISMELPPFGKIDSGSLFDINLKENNAEKGGD